MRRATARTFEELYFLVIDPNVPAPPASGDEMAFAVRFEGPLRGSVRVSMPEPLTRVIAANLLGSDEAVEPWLARDTAGELANVVCGHILPELFGVNAVFRIDAPQVVTAADAGSALVGETAMAVEGQRVGVALYVAAEAA